MIREFETQDSDTVLTIWLEASIKAHSFVPEKFWESKLDDMRNIYIPMSETWVYELDGELVGFFSLYQNTLAAIFVSPAQQRKGIGKELLDIAKQLRKYFELTAYSENTNSLGFYKKQDFSIVREQVDEHTGRKELLMEWKAE